jgi:hypothetical protein
MVSGSTGSYSIGLGFIILFGTPNYTATLELNSATHGQSFYTPTSSPYGANGVIFDNVTGVSEPDGTDYVATIHVTDGVSDTDSYTWPYMVELTPSTAWVVVDDTSYNSNVTQLAADLASIAGAPVPIIQYYNATYSEMSQYDMVFWHTDHSTSSYSSVISSTEYSNIRTYLLNGGNFILWCPCNGARYDTYWNYYKYYVLGISSTSSSYYMNYRSSSSSSYYHRIQSYWAPYNGPGGNGMWQLRNYGSYPYYYTGYWNNYQLASDASQWTWTWSSSRASCISHDVNGSGAGGEHLWFGGYYYNRYPEFYSGPTGNRPAMLRNLIYNMDPALLP